MKETAESEALIKVKHFPQHRELGTLEVFVGNSEETSKPIAHFTDVSSSCSINVSICIQL